MFFNKKSKNNITVLSTMKDQMKDDAVWCATFKLVWDDFQYNILENNFTCQRGSKIVDNLINSAKIENNIISEDDYYKTVGRATTELKEQIEEDIMARFNEKSKILDNINFEENKTDNILLYTMLKKVFLFKNKFHKLRKAKFGNSRRKVEYFGIGYRAITTRELLEQVRVLFYNDNNDFSVMLHTRGRDKIILYRTDSNNNFESVFNEIMQKSKNYYDVSFHDRDILKIPNLSINIIKRYDEISKNIFVRNRDNVPFVISDVIQTIEFMLDRSGGKLLSEVMLDGTVGSLITERRNFNFNDTFYLFLIEEDKELPYFALRVHDIENFI